MQQSEAGLLLSATDLANHLSCQHATQLDLSAAAGELKPPFRDDPRLEALQQRGLDFERAYVRQPEEAGLSVARAEALDGRTAEQHVRELMGQGVDAILQAPLSAESWRGRADVLLRIERSSNLGPWSYEPLDTKLARLTRGETILQLCLYAELLEPLLGHLPESLHVVKPDVGLERESFRTLDYFGYYQVVKRRLLESVQTKPETYPEPVSRCDTCRWWPQCDTRWRTDDHMSLVAGATRLHRKELSLQGARTTAELAAVPLPLPFRPSRGAAETYERLREQARLQVEQRGSGSPKYELLPVEPERGLTRLPEPSDGDMFFDIEGDPFIGTRGLEYLFGWVVQEDGAWNYRGTWCSDITAEKRMFESFIDAVEARWEQYPSMHVYHFGAYEPGTLKRLMGHHASREEALDRMLRGRLFVDLHTVLRQGVRAGVERYSLKDLEPFHNFQRSLDLRDAALARRDVEVALELGGGLDPESDQARCVSVYNEDDCRSTQSLRDWLELLRREQLANGAEVPRPERQDPEPSEALSEQRQRANALVAALLTDVPEDPADWTLEHQAQSLLASLIDWERREYKVDSWEYFRLCDLESEDLLNERAALAYLVFDGEAPGTGRTPTHRYRFVPQETSIREDDELRGPGGVRIGKAVAVDPEAGTLEVKKRGDAVNEHPSSLFAYRDFGTAVLANAVFELGEWVLDHGVNAPGKFRAARDLLLRIPPRRREGASPELRRDEEDGLAAALRLVTELEQGVLAVQGPPGTGKTFTGARAILALIREGKKVGVTANSHEVIKNLLKAVAEAAQETGESVSIIQKVRDVDPNLPDVIQQTKDNGDVLSAVSSCAAMVAGGTPWLWARPDMRESVDVLVVDEAGQLSLARTLAVALAARSLVMLGDPRQLEQPIRGSHPEGADLSALEHLLDEHQTVPSDMGLFLDVSYRLHPSICDFTSTCFYEGRLSARPELAHQALCGETPLAGAGLWLLPVEHDGNQVNSPEEVEAIARLVEHLIGGGVMWRNADGAERPLVAGDVLVVAPFNSQVAAISARLPGIRVGTVDKFQGQQAPVVIYSLTTSRPEDAPRGMEFLYSANRLNVATSRAQGAVVMVGDAHLFSPDCRTPKQMQLANSFCVFAAAAQRISADAGAGE